jgi:hypothetical protein
MYAEFCRQHALPLHFQPWWLDAVCTGGEWGACLAATAGGEAVGVLPWYRTRRYGLPVVIQPPLTAYAGPWLTYPSNPGFKLSSRYGFEQKIYADLIGQLPRAAFFRQSFHPECTNWLPFYWKGFRQTTRYTYRFDTIPALVELRAGFRASLRTDLRKAGRLSEAERDDTAGRLLFDLHRQSFGRQGKSPPYDEELFLRLLRALSSRGQAAIFIARGRAGAEPHAGLCLAFDRRQASVLLTGTAPAGKRSGAVYSLLWEALAFCRERGLALDLEGSMNPAIEYSFRGLGAPLTPYFQVTKVALGIF